MSGTHNSYQSINGSGPNHKRTMNPVMRYNHPHQSAVNMQHDDLIKYIYESWDKVYREYHHRSTGNGRNGPTVNVEYFQERESNPLPKDFRPFDLDAWWGKKPVQNITASHQMAHHSS